MSDIFREVEEDVRRERVEKLWKQYGDYAIAGVAIVVIAVAGWQFYKYYHGQQVARASDAYAVAASKAAAGNPQEAAADFAKLAKDAPSGYAAISKLQQANALLGAGSVGDAVVIYKQIEAGSDTSMAAIARLRHAWAIVDAAPKSEITTLLAPLNDPASDWKYSAREVLAYSDYHNGQMAQAEAGFKGLSNDPHAPSGMRQRAFAMATFITAGAGRDVGTVPAAAPVAPPAPAAQTNGTPSP